MHDDFAIHPDDDMFTGDHEHYESCGKQFAEIIAHAASLSGAHSPKILELPCGYGRVTRHLVARFGASLIDVADIMSPAVDFVARKFGVRGFVVTEPVNQFRGIPDGVFDVAVMGSLLTHLSESDALDVLEHFLKKLGPNGVAVITTHGERSYDMLRAGGWHEVSPSDRLKLLHAHERGAHEFVQYDPNHVFERKTVDYIGPSYGVSITHPSWMRDAARRLGYTIREYRPGGWDNHQDVFFISAESIN